MNRPEEEQGLDQGIFPSQPEHITPSREEITGKKQWKPWHKPRKQWVREKQWVIQISQLIDELNLTDRPLRYLSLPGEDLLDIRVVRNLCEEKNVQHLKCLGFDDGTYSPETEAELNISRNEVLQSPLIFPGSDVIKDDFAMLANEASQAYKSAKECGPYDIINLDLCDSISSKEGGSYHRALNNLINYQIAEHNQPWLLFLTTRADKSEVNIDDFNSYCVNLKRNVEHSDVFKQELEQFLNSPFDQLSRKLEQGLLELGEARFERLFGLCVGKWLLHLMLSGNPLWVTDMLDSCWYRVSSAKTPNMLSLAFRFHQITEPRQDPSGLIPAPDDSGGEVNEAVLALEILRKTGSFTDVDELLINDRALYNEMVEKSEKLLGSARYPIKEYSSWAKKKQRPLVTRLRN